jgi:hypothetical protein
MTQRLQQDRIGLCERVFELGQPVFGGDRNIIGFIEHARFSSPAVYAAFP